MAEKSIKQFDEKSDERVYVSVRETLESARGKVERAVNSAMVEAYWEIGRQIVEATGERAEYGKHLLQYLSERLTVEYGNQCSVRNLRYMAQFYRAFPIVNALRSQLSWTHYRGLMRIPDQEQREFYMNAAADERWTSRQLDHQIATFYRERLLSSQGEKRELIRSDTTSSSSAMCSSSSRLARSTPRTWARWTSTFACSTRGTLALTTTRPLVSSSARAPTGQ